MTNHPFDGAGRLCRSCGSTLNAPVHSVPDGGLHLLARCFKAAVALGAVGDPDEEA